MAFGFSQKKTRVDASSTDNSSRDSSIQASDSTIQKLESGAIMANELGAAVEGSSNRVNSSDISAGANSTIGVTGDVLARIVESAHSAIGRATGGGSGGGRSSIFPTMGNPVAAAKVKKYGLWGLLLAVLGLAALFKKKGSK